MHLTLGTAQLGMTYGLLNSKKINPQEQKKINNLVFKSKIKYIDTAPTYGDSEKIIGNSPLKTLNIITKIKIPKKNKDFNIQSWLRRKISFSLSNLKARNIYGLLVHDYKDLLGRKGKIYLSCLQDLKKKKIIKNIGISIYSPKELNVIWKFWKPDIVQAPLNIFDTRIADSGWLNVLKKNKIKIFIRSIFLQGLLINDLSHSQINKYFLNHSNKFKIWCKKKNISSLVACINFVKSFKQIDYIIVGINNYAHLKNIIDVYKSKKNMHITKKFATNNLNIIDPRKW